MAEVEITTELQEIQSNLWGVNVRENIALALEKLQNLPEEPNLIQGSLNLSLLDTASWKLGLLKNSIQSKSNIFSHIHAPKIALNFLQFSCNFNFCH